MAALPDHMRAAQWTTVPIETSLKVNPGAPLPKNANKLPKNSALVRIAYASLNPVDYKVAELGVARMTAMGRGPWIPCSDYAGTVVATNLPHLKVGDRVAGFSTVPAYGGLAEYAVVEGAESIGRIPDGVDLKDAATLGIAAQTAFQCIEPYVKAGSNVLINGASGGTGSFGIQIAKILGCTVTAICSGANVEVCKSLGADRVIDYTSADVIGELKGDASPYDLIVNNVGVAGPIYTESQHYLRPDGQYVTIAGGPDLPSVVGLVRVMAQPAWLGGVGRRSRFIGCKANREQLERLAAWVAEGKLKPCIGKVYPLDEAATAFRDAKYGKTRGKLVVRVSQD